MKKWQYFIISSVILGLLIGLGVTLNVATKPNLSANESLLLGILISIFSILISWIATHIYSQLSLKEITEEVKRNHAENLNTYAEKAAEKVFNLSNEFDRLKENLTSIIEDTEDDENIENINLILRERILLTIHLVETLRSMNDTFLSDWKGVIGDKIQKQQSLEIQIDEISKELARQMNLKEDLESQVVSYEEIESIQKHIDQIEQGLEQKLKALPFGFRAIASTRKPKKRNVEIPCPNCNSLNIVNIRPRGGARKVFHCEDCNTHIKIVYSNATDYTTEIIPLIDIEVECPLCKSSIPNNIPNIPGALKKITCRECELQIIVTKKKDGVNIKTGYAKNIPQKVLDIVLDKLPPQPWEKSIHIKIAEELGLSNTVVNKAIGVLLNQGKFPNEKRDTLEDNTPNSDANNIITKEPEDKI